MNILHTFPFSDYNLYVVTDDSTNYPTGHITVPFRSITAGEWRCPNLHALLAISMTLILVQLLSLTISASNSTQSILSISYDSLL